jgi:SAM-dependent methyltransferase
MSSTVRRERALRTAERLLGGSVVEHRLMNLHLRLRRKTVPRRLRVVAQLLEEHGIAGKRVLALGCESGEPALIAARMGAQVTGLDGVGAHVAAARRQSRAAGLEDVTEFYVADVTTTPLRPADITLIVRVCEACPEVASFLKAACEATGELLVIVDGGGPWWWRGGRQLRARLKGRRLHHRAPEEFRAMVEMAGFVETRRVRGLSFWAMAYRRQWAA